MEKKYVNLFLILAIIAALVGALYLMLVHHAWGIGGVLIFAAILLALLYLSAKRMQQK